MRTVAIAIAMAIAMTMSLGIPAAQAKQCPKLNKQCQHELKTSKAEAATKDKAKKLCEEGMALHNDGKHDDSVKKLKEGLALLEKR